MLPIVSAVRFIFSLLLWLTITVVSVWAAFSKAGRPGWAAIVPIYNILVFLDIAGKPWWWLFLFFLPLANLVFGVMAGIGFAQNFGKGAGLGVAMSLPPFVGWPLVAFGDAEYRPEY